MGNWKPAIWDRRKEEEDGLRRKLGQRRAEHGRAQAINKGCRRRWLTGGDFGYGTEKTTRKMEMLDGIGERTGDRMDKREGEDVQQIWDGRTKLESWLKKKMDR